MRRALIIVSLLLAVVLFAQGIDTTKVLSNSKLELRESAFNFGVAPAGQRMTHHFVLKSVGEDPLLIEQVRATCGCTSAPLENDSLAPGDSTLLKVTFNSSGYHGRKARKSVKITSNDKDKKVESVTFTVDVDTLKYSVIKPEPYNIDLGRNEDFKKETVVLLKNILEAGDPVEVKLVSFDFDIIEKVDIKDTKLKSGEETEITVTLREDVDPNSRIQSSFTLEANDANNSRITIPIRGGMVSQSGRHPKTPKNNRDSKEK